MQYFFGTIFDHYTLTHLRTPLVVSDLAQIFTKDFLYVIKRILPMGVAKIAKIVFLEPVYSSHMVEGIKS